MAFNWSTFKTRTFTAIIFAAVMLAGLLWNQWSFLVLFSIVHFGCWWEYLKLTEKIHATTFHVYTKLGLMVMGYGLMLWFCGNEYHFEGYFLKENLSLPVSGAGFALLLMGVFQKNNINLKGFAMAVLGLVYISLCWGLMLDLCNRVEISYADSLYIVDANMIPVTIVAAIWINDTMAYLVGSLIGKTSSLQGLAKKNMGRNIWRNYFGYRVLAFVLWNYLTSIHTAFLVILSIFGFVCFNCSNCRSFW